MKDFDFDELDRAVNSVLATKDTKSAQDDQAADTQVATTDTEEENTVVPVTTSNESTQEQSSPEASSGAIAVTDDQPDDDGSEPITVNTTTTAEPSAKEEETNVEEPLQAEDKSKSEHNVSNEPTLPVEAPELEPVEDQSAKEETAEPEAKGEDQASEEKPAVDTAALAAIPVKRGRFMDVVAPSNAEGAKKAFPTRTGVTITPSADFSAATPEEQTAKESEPAPTTTDPATPIVSEEVEPDVTASSTDSESDTPEVPAAEPVAPADTAPFIPDVPVEKRPLNDLSNDDEAQDSATNEETKTDAATAAPLDPTLTANVPKEFDKEIMAVESNETVGENDETHPDSAVEEAKTESSAPAIAATTAEPHPMFDTSTLAHPGDVHGGHHTSKFSWAIIGGSLFIVGAALGVLYFLYGQG